MENLNVFGFQLVPLNQEKFNVFSQQTNDRKSH